MSCTTDPQPSHCPKSLRILVAYAVELFRRVEKAIEFKDTSYLPAKIRRAANKNPDGALTRVQSAVDLAIALARTLAGDLFYLRARIPPRATPAQPAPARAQTAPKPPKPRLYSEADRERDRDRRLRHTFHTQPIYKLARRIARQLGLNDDSDLYPFDCETITETPAQWSQTHFGPIPPYTPPITVPKGWKPPKPTKLPAPQPPLESAEPTPHPRE